MLNLLKKNYKMVFILILIIGASLLFINRTGRSNSEPIQKAQEFEQEPKTTTEQTAPPIYTNSTFAGAFAEARSELGPDQSFIWNYGHYTTNYIPEDE